MSNKIFYISVIYFLLLLGLSEIIRRHFYNKKNYSSAAGSIVMAIGIFSLTALQRLAFENEFISRLLALELLIIWLYIAASYLICYLRGYFCIFLRRVYDQFSVGTWVAGCAVLALVFLREFPSWILLIWTMTALSLAIWLVYLPLVIKNFWHILFGNMKSHTGVILLSTVSTQSIVILLNILLPNYIPEYVNKALIIVGYIFYLVGIIIILRYYITIKPKHIFIRWSNTNSIIHGALSITGLASLVSHVMSDNLVTFTWIAATCFFVLVESVSLIKLYQRIRMASLSKGAYNYDVSQWSRIFTYGMYYTFTLVFSESYLLSNTTVNVIKNYGQYAVLGMLLIECVLFFKAKLGRQPRLN